MNSVIERPIRIVNALTVLSLPLLSLARKNSALNRLPTITIKVNTIMTFINMISPKMNSDKYYESHMKQIQS